MMHNNVELKEHVLTYYSLVELLKIVFGWWFSSIGGQNNNDQ